MALDWLWAGACDSGHDELGFFIGVNGDGVGFDFFGWRGAGVDSEFWGGVSRDWEGIYSRSLM